MRYDTDDDSSDEFPGGIYDAVLAASAPPSAIPNLECDVPTTAAIYTRRSIADDQSRSTRRQVTRAVAYCRTSGISIDLDKNLFVDKNRSGSTRIGRKGLADMLSAAADQRFHVLVVDSICRISRRVVDALEIVEELKSFGVEVHVSGVGRQGDDELAVHALHAQLDHLDLNARLQGSRRQSAAAGRLIGSYPRYGYRSVRDGADLAIDLPEACILRRCFTALQLGVGKTELARQLNAEGVPSPNGGLWSYTTFLQRREGGLLQSRLYKGVYEWGRHSCKPVVIQRPDLAIVSEEQYDAVATLPTLRGNFSSNTRERRLLHGVKCSCGSAMWISNTGSYRCRSARYSGGCSNVSLVRIAELEREVLRFLHDDVLKSDRLSFWQDVRLRSWSNRRATCDEQRIELKLRLAAIDAQMDELENGPDARDPHAIEQMGYLEFEYHSSAQELAAVDPAPPAPSIEIVEAETLRAGVRRLLGHLPAGLQSPEDIQLAARLREFLPCIVVGAEIDGERVVQFLVGIPGCPEGTNFASNSDEERWISKRLSRVDNPRMRYPEAVLRQHADAEAGAFRLSDTEWRRVEHLFVPFCTGQIDVRLVAEALICMATTGLTQAELPERYLDVATVWKRSRAPGLWADFLKLLGPRRKLLDTKYNRWRFQPLAKSANDDGLP